MELSDKLQKEINIYYSKLKEIAPQIARSKPAESKWSKKEYLGHLVDSASNNHQRFVRCQFENNLSVPSYDQPNWVKSHDYQGIDWYELIEFWYSYNNILCRVLENIPNQHYDNTLKIGVGGPYTLKFVAEDYIEHMVDHLEQITSE